MNRKPPKPLAERIVTELVRKSWEPMQMLIDRKKPIQEEIDRKIKAGEDTRQSGRKPENFTVSRDGRNERDYNYTLHFEYRLGKNEPVLGGISLTIDGLSHKEYVTDIRKLPSYYTMLERVLSNGVQHSPKDRTIAPDNSSSLKP